MAWIRPAHPRFLLPGYVLSTILRAKMRDALTRPGVGADVDPRVWRRRWAVHVQPIGSGDHATLYLSRYVYRVALTNQRLDRFVDGRVTLQYTHARPHTTRSLTAPVDDFLTRFLHHVLPRGFTKVRWYGLLSASRRTDLERARTLLASRHPPDDGVSVATTPEAAVAAGSAERSTPVGPSARDHPTPGVGTTSPHGHARCPHGRWVLVQRYPPPRAPPACPRAA